MSTLAASISSLLVLGLAPGPNAEHAEHVAARPKPSDPGAFVRAPRDPSAATYTSWVYGYYAFWAGTVGEIRWDRVSHVALFDVELKSTGAFDNEYLITDVIDEALALAEPYGARVHISAICFDDVTMSAVLPDPIKRGIGIDQLVALVADTGAHGVSIDYEGMDAVNILDLVTFVEELKAALPPGQDEVTVATPAIDWSSAYHYPKLAAAADALFIMGYGYHWSGGNPGPVAPLHGGDPWSKYSLEWTLDDYLATGAPADKLVMGLPLYGHNWPTVDTSVPGESTGKSKSITYADAVVEAETYGRKWDAVTHTPYYFPAGDAQVWYDDAASLEDKITWSIGQGMLGVGFWALNYEGGDPVFWDMVAEHTQSADEPTTTGGDTTGGTDGSGGAGTDGSGGTGTGGSAGSGTDGTSGGSGSGGSASGGSGGAGTESGTSDAGTSDASATGGGGEEDEGCGCSAAPRPAGWLGLGLFGLAFARRRARR